MSTIFGIRQAGGRPIEPPTIEAVSQAMHHWQPDGSGVWTQEGIVLGHLMLRNSPESLGEENPHHHGGCSIVCDARIDNRTDILTVLSSERDLSAQTPDSHLILRLYLRLGTSCVERIIGDFAFAIWDAGRRELFCARDHMGVRPLFYHHRGDLFVFSSEQRGILAHPGVSSTLDRDFVHCLLGGIPPEPDSTFHESVRHLLPGHWARFTDEGLTIRRYWSLRRPERLLKGSPSELRAGFLETLEGAVRDRLRTVHPVGCELSGGLDSSVVTTLAARLIDDRSRLHTFSAVLPVDDSGRKPFEDEERYADEVIRHAGIVHAVKVSSSGRTALFDSHELELDVCSGVDIFSSFWLEPFRRIMSERGIRTCLSGFLGDELVTHHGKDFFEEYPREGRWADFIGTSVKASGILPTARRLAGHILPDHMKAAIRGRPSSTFDRGYLRDGSLHQRLLQSHLERQGPIASGYKDRLIRNATNLHARQRMQSEVLYGIRHRMEPRYPLADIRLLQYVLALPAGVIGKVGEERHLMKESLKGVLSETIRQRTDKQVAAGVFYIVEERTRADGLRDWLEDIARNPMHPILEPIDMDRVVRSLDPSDPANLWEGAFYPRLSFQIQCLLRFFADSSRG